MILNDAKKLKLYLCNSSGNFKCYENLKKIRNAFFFLWEKLWNGIAKNYIKLVRIIL